MNKQELIETAAAIPRVDREVALAYGASRELMVAHVNRAMSGRADVLRLVGADNLRMMENNHANHGRFVEAILQHPDPVVLVDTVLWVIRTYRAHGFSLAYWPAQLNAWVDAMRAHLTPAQVAAVYPLYEWFIVRQPSFVALAEAPDADGAASAPRHG